MKIPKRPKKAALMAVKIRAERKSHKTAHGRDNARIIRFESIDAQQNDFIPGRYHE